MTLHAVPKPSRVIDRDYLKAIAQRSCCICIWLGEKQVTRTEAHHTTTRGAFGGDDTAAPVCKKHHQQWHLLGRKTFLLRFRIDLAGVAAAFWKMWTRYGSLDR